MKIGFVSLGCPKNLVDSEVMIGLVEHAGHHITPDAADAEVLVVNTCAFIDAAKQESIDTILELAELKKTGACRRLVVTGCLAQRYAEELQAQIGEIDAILGTGAVPDIVAAVGGHAPATTSPVRLFRSRTEAGLTSDAPPEAPEYLYDAQTPRHRVTPAHYAYIKIAEGCDYSCAFCIIPTLRGHYRSRSRASIVEEATRLADQGVREVLLVSQDTSFYGVDQGERGALARLLHDLNKVPGLAWIRLLYLYPTTVSDDVLGAMADCEHVVPYVDLPLQHASASVLKRMKRPGTGTTYRRLLDRIRRQVPGVTLRTTFVVGFPGETDEEFADLETFVRDVGFDQLGAFEYSHEEGTPAFSRIDDVPKRVKTRRRNRLMSLQRKLVARSLAARVGQTVRVLVDGPAPDHELVLRGRHAGQAPDIDSCVYLTDADPDEIRAGTFVDGTVVEARGYDLVVQPLPGI